MPRKQLPGLPFPPLVKLNADKPITEAQLGELLKKGPKGLTVCVRSGSGHKDRGGYFFHLLPLKGLSECIILDFEKRKVITLDLRRTTALINHCSGLSFSETEFQLCQQVINLKTDPTS